jgi:1-acyl-sn-glycerol-3-phosphate acyltransferase
MSEKAVSSDLAAGSRLALLVQREFGRLLSPLWITSVVLLMRYVYRVHIRNVEETRRRYREIIRESDQPLLICANHLTLVDSVVVTWALGSAWWYLFHFSKMPWHVPERKNFASSWYNRLFIYLMKCVPVVRGSNRQEVSLVLSRLEYLMSIGEVVFLFPEGTRSRTGRIQATSAAHGVGRIINETPGCRVLCVYMRGDHQETWGEIPVSNESFYVDISLLAPKSDLRGMRRSQDLAQQVLEHLMQMEKRYFDGRPPPDPTK